MLPRRGMWPCHSIEGARAVRTMVARARQTLDAPRPNGPASRGDMIARYEAESSLAAMAKAIDEE